MRIHSVSISVRDDGKRRLEVFASGKLFRYAIDNWVPWSPESPHEPRPGYWSETYISGFYDSADAAMKDALVSHFGSEIQE